MKYRVTFENEPSTRFSYVEDNHESLEEGEWESPNLCSSAQNLVDALMQSDRCPMDFFDSPIVSVKVRKMNE